MKAVFKPETAKSDDHNEDYANPDVSMIDQTDVIETCLLLRDSVISLKAVIRDLQQEVTDLKSHVTRLDGRLTSKGASTNVDAAEPDTVPAVNALIPTAPQLETIEGTPPEENPPHVADNDNFQFPKSHQKKLLNGNIGITSQRSGIFGTSTDPLSFSGTMYHQRVRSDQFMLATVTLLHPCPLYVHTWARLVYLSLLLIYYP